MPPKQKKTSKTKGKQKGLWKTETVKKIRTTEDPTQYHTFCTLLSWNLDRNDKKEYPEEKVSSFRREIIHAYTACKQPDFYMLQELTNETETELVKMVMSDRSVSARSLDNLQWEARLVWNGSNPLFKIIGILTGQLQSEPEPNLGLKERKSVYKGFLDSFTGYFDEVPKLSLKENNVDFKKFLNQNRACMAVFETTMPETLENENSKKILIGSYHQSNVASEQKKPMFCTFIELAEKAAEEFGCNGNYILGSDTNFANAGTIKDIDNAMELYKNKTRKEKPNCIYNGKDALLWKFPDGLFSISGENTEYDIIENFATASKICEAGQIPFVALFNHNPVTLALKMKTSSLTEKDCEKLRELKEKKEKARTEVQKMVNDQLEYGKKERSKSMQDDFQTKITELYDMGLKHKSDLSQPQRDLLDFMEKLRITEKVERISLSDPKNEKNIAKSGKRKVAIQNRFPSTLEEPSKKFKQEPSTSSTPQAQHLDITSKRQPDYARSSVPQKITFERPTPDWFQKCIAILKIYDGISQQPHFGRKFQFLTDTAPSTSAGNMIDVNPDGNCFFRALSVAISGSQEHHAKVRTATVEQMKSEYEKYTGLIGEDLDTYLKRTEMTTPALTNSSLEKNSLKWATHNEIKAAATLLEVVIRIFSPIQDNDDMDVENTALWHTILPYTDEEIAERNITKGEIAKLPTILLDNRGKHFKLVLNMYP